MTCDIYVVEKISKKSGNPYKAICIRSEGSKPLLISFDALTMYKLAEYFGCTVSDLTVKE